MMKNIDRPTLILAFILAIFLWAYVRISQEGPPARRVMKVPVQLVVASGMKASLRSGQTTVDIPVRGVPEAVNTLMPDEIDVKVDLSDITKAATVKKRATVRLPSSVRLEGNLPLLSIATEVLEQKTLPVKVSFIAVPPPGAVIGQYVTTPDIVTVEGTKDALRRVKYVTLPVDPSVAMPSSLEIAPRAVDAKGERVDDVSVMQASVEVRLASGAGTSSTRAVAVHPPDLQQPSRKFIVSVDKVRPDQVTLSGEPAVLERQPAYLETEPINISGITHDTTVTVQLRIPHGLTVVEGSTVRVDLVVDRAP